LLSYKALVLDVAAVRRIEEIWDYNGDAEKKVSEE